MRKLLFIVATLQFALSVAAAQPSSAPAPAKTDFLSMEQTTQIGEIITKEATPLTNVSFSVAVDGIVPPEVQLRPLPPSAEELAPQLRGFGYVVVEEQIALVDQHSRKIVAVVPRWRRPGSG